MNSQSISVLYVDDNEDDVLLMQECISEIPFARLHHVAMDGEQAIEFLFRRGEHQGAPRPDIVLLDIRMPKKDGFEVLREMKSDHTLRAIPVIMVTTSRRDDDVIRSYADGACSYICKQTVLDQFIDTMTRFFTYWHAVSRLPRLGSTNH